MNDSAVVVVVVVELDDEHAVCETDSVIEALLPPLMRND